MRKLLLLLLLPVFSQAQSSGNDMFRAEAYGTLITITPLKCSTLVIDGAVGSKLYDTSFTVTGATSFTIAPSLIGQELKFRTQTKCGDQSNSSWVSFKVVAPLGMPVKVVHFSAKAVNNKVEILYHVETTEGDNFDIEKSTDGKTFRPLFYAVVSTVNPYVDKRTLTDHNLQEKNFYRIKMYTAGKITYSPTVVVSGDTSGDIISIYNLSGVRLRTLRERDLEASLAQMPRGLYIIRGKSTIQKISTL